MEFLKPAARVADLVAHHAGIGMARGPVALLFAWVVLLLAGTLKLEMLTGTYMQIELPLSSAAAWHERLNQLVPFDAAKGEEGVSIQGVALIVLLVSIVWAAWRALENIQDGANRWTRASLALIAATLRLPR